MRHLLSDPLILGTLLIAGCAVGPNYSTPEQDMVIEDTFINTGYDLDQDNAPETAWWKQIGDSNFQAYVETLLKDNLELKEIGERVLQANERRIIQGGSLYPAIRGNASGSRSAQRFDINNQRFYVNRFDTDLSVSWQLDLFGRIRRSIESAEATLQATEAERDALIQSLIADLANRWISVSVNAQLLELAQENVANRKMLHELVQSRYNLGTQN